MIKERGQIMDFLNTVTKGLLSKLAGHKGGALVATLGACVTIYGIHEYFKTVRAGLEYGYGTSLSINGLGNLAFNKSPLENTTGKEESPCFPENIQLSADLTEPLSQVL